LKFVDKALSFENAFHFFALKFNFLDSCKKRGRRHSLIKGIVKENAGCGSPGFGTEWRNRACPAEQRGS